MPGAGARLLLAGGGHSHIEVLRRLALRPVRGAVVTLVTPDPALTYTGMVPGIVAGHYRPEAARIDLAALARRAGAMVTTDVLAGLDLDARCALLGGGDRVHFDLLSLDVGAAPAAAVPGVTAHAVPVKPVPALLARCEAIVADAAAGKLRSIVVAGAGAGGVELAFALRHRLRGSSAGVALTLVTADTHVLAGANAVTRARIESLLQQHGIAVLVSSPVTAITATTVTTGTAAIAADRVVCATGAAAPAWLAASGLACDARGFVRCDAYLRSVSHDFVYATGDCAVQDAHPRPRSGVYAVRQGPPLARNLARSVQGMPLLSFRPQREALALISTGDRHAVASRGPFTLEGDWVWRWKDRIDRRFVAKYAL